LEQLQQLLPDLAHISARMVLRNVSISTSKPSWRLIAKWFVVFLEKSFAESHFKHGKNQLFLVLKEKMHDKLRELDERDQKLESQRLAVLEQLEASVSATRS